ncbi:hypothetical protein [Vibrio rotiferianus]|jgi:hypothetical protein|uniref:hypothetical protein n=1 Tax=Vibrio rotiferianus TaxID=190895 RepID=UPI00406A352C
MKVLLELAVCSVIGTAALIGYGHVWDWVTVDNILFALISAVIMAVVLKTSVAFEKFAANACLNQSTAPKIKRFFSSWFILIGSKVIAMGAIVMLFGEQVKFSGPVDGVLSFYATIISVVILESILYKSISKKEQAETVGA